MKSIKFGVLLSLAISGVAFATDDAGTAIVSGESITNTAADCSLLSEPVTINLSSGVVGAYACDTTDNVIAVAACHPSGRKTVTFDCDPSLATDATGYVAGCEAVGTSTTVGTYTADAGVAYVASTSGGRVAGVAAEGCTGTGAVTTAEAETAAGI
ncbi:MAG: hypothetical protein R3355_13180 [Pseudomonas sp.]|uniref:hypothetical protein n=1 Tax=Pseudomonas sp. TaxID=306 RepID=UPI00299D1C47|nr:hypothetical protein [Pseudomonas sp.]MDX1724042.1 hypothetical protein [Pseudomonas sp.]